MDIIYVLDTVFNPLGRRVLQSFHKNRFQKMTGRGGVMDGCFFEADKAALKIMQWSVWFET